MSRTVLLLLALCAVGCYAASKGKTPREEGKIKKPINTVTYILYSAQYGSIRGIEFCICLLVYIYIFLFTLLRNVWLPPNSKKFNNNSLRITCTVPRWHYKHHKLWNKDILNWWKKEHILSLHLLKYYHRLTQWCWQPPATLYIINYMTALLSSLLT